jgi:hypothetical protein
MTRILLTLIVFLSLTSIVNAQLNKGSLLVGGTLSYSGNSNTFPSNDQNAHSGLFNVSLGKAINESSVFGVNLSYSFYHTSNYYYQGYQGPITYKTNNYSIGIFYRKYKSLGKDFYLFGEAGAGYDGSNLSGTDDLGNKNLSGTGNGGHINFYPGIDYKISKKFFLEISIPNLFLTQYSSNKTTAQNIIPPDSKGDQFVISSSLSSGPLDALGIGFRLIL